MFRLRELREECGIKRSKLAEDLQINAGTIANYENEIRQAPYEYLIKFAAYFDVSIDYLLGVKEDETPLTFHGLPSDEMRLLHEYRALSKVGKNRVLEYIDLWKGKD